MSNNTVLHICSALKHKTVGIAPAASFIELGPQEANLQVWSSTSLGRPSGWQFAWPDGWGLS